MKFLFEGKGFIQLTVIVVLVVGLSLIYQLFFVRSHSKDVYKGISNSYIIKQNDKIADTIFDFGYEHDYVFYLFKHYDGGCYFGEDNEGLNKELGNFIKSGKTVIQKQENDSIVYFINNDDTMSILFNVNKQNRVLSNWKRMN